MREHALQAHEVGAERGEVFQHALVVADEDVEVVDDRDDRSFRGRHWQPAHGHRHDETSGLQRHRLTAGVRAADDQRVVFAVE